LRAQGKHPQLMLNARLLVAQRQNKQDSLFYPNRLAVRNLSRSSPSGLESAAPKGCPLSVARDEALKV